VVGLRCGPLVCEYACLSSLRMKERGKPVAARLTSAWLDGVMSMCVWLSDVLHGACLMRLPLWCLHCPLDAPSNVMFFDVCHVLGCA
jgi:hypothetical protein